jgi:hypothetical protein
MCNHWWQTRVYAPDERHVYVPRVECVRCGEVLWQGREYGALSMAEAASRAHLPKEGLLAAKEAKPLGDPS